MMRAIWLGVVCLSVIRVASTVADVNATTTVYIFSSHGIEQYSPDGECGGMLDKTWSTAHDRAVAVYDTSTQAITVVGDDHRNVHFNGLTNVQLDESGEMWAITQPTFSLNKRRSNPSISLLADGQLYVCGCDYGEEACDMTCESLPPSGDHRQHRWTLHNIFLTCSKGATNTVVLNDDTDPSSWRVYSFGGGCSSEISHQMSMYDARANMWSYNLGGATDEKWIGHASVVVDRTLYSCGGVHSDCIAFSLETHTWSSMASMNVSRMLHRLVVDETNALIIALGGARPVCQYHRDSTRTMCVAGESLDSVEVYSLSDDMWTMQRQTLARPMRIFGAALAPVDVTQHPPCLQTFEDATRHTSESRKTVARTSIIITAAVVCVLFFVMTYACDNHCR